MTSVVCGMKIFHYEITAFFRRIRPIYLALHRGSTPFDEDQLCSIPSHRIDSASNLDGVDGGRTAETARANPIQGTKDPSAISTMVNNSFHSMSSHGTDPGSRPTRNMTTAIPTFIIPDTVPSRIPLLTVGGEPVAPHISTAPTMNQSGRPPDDGSISHSSSQIPTRFPLTQGISGFDSNAATEIGPLNAPDDTPDPNRHVMLCPSHSHHLPLMWLSMACDLKMAIRLRLLAHPENR